LVAYNILWERYHHKPSEPGLSRLIRRLDAIASVEPESPSKPDKADQQEIRALTAFFEGRDHDAIILASYARSLAPDRKRLSRISSRLEALTDMRLVLTPAGRNLWEDKHARAEEDYRSRDFAGGVTNCSDAILLEPDDLLARERLGSNLYMIGKFEQAAAAWKDALPYEKTPEGQQAVRSYIERAKEAMAGRVASPADVRAVATPASLKPPASPAAGDIQDLIELGLKYRARGDLAAAAETFDRVLKIDPENAAALKNLEQVRQRQP
jgi:tetratricopeptide (TPR) repeat protein